MVTSGQCRSFRMGAKNRRHEWMQKLVPQISKHPCYWARGFDNRQRRSFHFESNEVVVIGAYPGQVGDLTSCWSEWHVRIVFSASLREWLNWLTMSVSQHFVEHISDREGISLLVNCFLSHFGRSDSSGKNPIRKCISSSNSERYSIGFAQICSYWDQDMLLVTIPARFVFQIYLFWPPDFPWISYYVW